MGSKISNTEWGLVIGALAMVDVFQIILDMVAIGIAANRIIDLGVAAALPLYLTLRGYKLDTRTIMLVGGSFIGEEIPVLDAAPFWTFDGWKIWGWDKQRKAQDAVGLEESA